MRSTPTSSTSKRLRLRFSAPVWKLVEKREEECRVKKSDTAGSDLELCAEGYGESILPLRMSKNDDRRQHDGCGTTLERRFAPEGELEEKQRLVGVSIREDPGFEERQET